MINSIIRKILLLAAPAAYIERTKRIFSSLLWAVQPSFMPFSRGLVADFGFVSFMKTIRHGSKHCRKLLD